MRRLSRYIPVTILVVLFVTGSLAGFSRPVAAAGPVSIAIMGPFTGPVAFLGKEQLNFAKLAVDDFKKSSGMSDITLVEVDTQLDPAKAVTGSQSIVSNSAVVGVVGPAGRQEVEAVSKAFETAQIAF